MSRVSGRDFREKSLRSTLVSSSRHNELLRRYPSTNSANHPPQSTRDLSVHTLLLPRISRKYNTRPRSDWQRDSVSLRQRIFFTVSRCVFLLFFAPEYMIDRCAIHLGVKNEIHSFHFIIIKQQLTYFQEYPYAVSRSLRRNSNSKGF